MGCAGNRAEDFDEGEIDAPENTCGQPEVISRQVARTKQDAARKPNNDGADDRGIRGTEMNGAEEHDGQCDRGPPTKPFDKDSEDDSEEQHGLQSSRAKLKRK